MEWQTFYLELFLIQWPILFLNLVRLGIRTVLPTLIPATFQGR